MERMKRVYVAGTISFGGQLTEEEEIIANIHRLRRYAQELRDAGYEVVDPTTLHEDDEASPDHVRKSWADYMKADISALVTCDAIALTPGWHRGRGPRLEHYLAVELGLEVIEWPS
jgi:Domain of unknown function (DUF4406)